jgi:hypothetical protein
LNIYFSCILELKLNLKSDIYSNFDRLKELKNLFIEIRNTINRLDKSLSLIITIDLIETMVGLMINIYALTVSEQNINLKQYTNTFAFKSITVIIKWILNCYINGLLHEESDEIYAVLDHFNSSDLFDKEYKELLLFKTVSREKMFGFTIGGFAALRKTTLISV